ncbi:MAG: tyrosine-type recombinase/integrase, partial [Candidatus Latescibacterota bacterium]|nr:tyrosine-type recombinase/integrase [Candidatus Latescibacterota bacterium]
DWCVQRGYLDTDPLKALVAFDTTALTVRRALNEEEVARLLDNCAPTRRMLLETALMSGLRAGELRSLTTDHLDVERGGLILDARWTKNRSEGFQRLPRSLVARLHAYAQSGEPERLSTPGHISAGTPN